MLKSISPMECLVVVLLCRAHGACTHAVNASIILVVSYLVPVPINTNTFIVYFYPP